MIEVSIEDILNYMQCPLRFKFIKLQKKQAIEEDLLSRQIKSLYTYHLQTGKLMSWRNFRSKAELFIRKKIVDVGNNKERSQIKTYLSCIHRWYFNYYLAKYCDIGFVNVPLSLGLGYRIRLKDAVDIITCHNQTRLFEIDAAYTSIKDVDSTLLYNDFAVHLRIWLFWKTTETFPDEYVRIISGQGTVMPVSLFPTMKMAVNVERLIKYILRGISEGIYYPVISTQCNNCDFFNQCSMQEAFN